KEMEMGVDRAFSQRAVQFTPDGKYFFSRLHNDTIHKWDAATKKELDPPLVTRGILSPDGKVVLGPAGTRPLLEVATGKELARVPIHRGIALGGDARRPDLMTFFSPDGNMLAVPYEAGEDKVTLYEVLTGKVRHNIAIDRSSAPATRPPAVLFFSEDSKTFAAFVDFRTLGFWDTGSGQRIGTFTPATRGLPKNPATIHSGAFSPDGRSVALAQNDGTVDLYEFASGQLRRSFGMPVVPIGVRHDIESLP